MKVILKSTIALFFITALLLTSFVSAANLEDIKDMPAATYYATDALKWAVTQKLIDPVDGNISPASDLLRAELADIMVRYAGSGAAEIDIARYYTDLDKNAWYYSSICKAFRLGIIKGYANLMRPLDKLTREEAFTILARTLNLKDESKDVAEMKKFGDVTDVSDWAVAKVAALVKAGYVLGDGSNINPKKNITKEEFLTIIYRMRTITPPTPIEPPFVPSDSSFSNYMFVLKSDNGPSYVDYGLVNNEDGLSLSIKNEVADTVELADINLQVSTVSGSGKRTSLFGMTLEDGKNYTGQELFNQLATISEGLSNYVQLGIPVEEINKTNGTIGDLRDLFKLVNHVYSVTINQYPQIWAGLGITMHSDTSATILYDIYDNFGNKTDSGVAITLNVNA
jgi:S-layer homology domain.